MRASIRIDAAPTPAHRLGRSLPQSADRLRLGGAALAFAHMVRSVVCERTRGEAIAFAINGFDEPRILPKT